jgi:hypothetical protein
LDTALVAGPARATQGLSVPGTSFAVSLAGSRAGSVPTAPPTRYPRRHEHTTPISSRRADDPPLLKIAAHCDDCGVTTRRFPAPWRADKMPCGYVVRDANGQAPVYVYSRETEAEALQAKVLTADEARRIAINVAKVAGTVKT